MTTGDAESYRPSGFMRNALVAERVFANADDQALTIPLNDADDWTELLGEQMNVRVSYQSDLHSVLLYMLPEIERSLSQWPPPQTLDDWLPLARLATEGMTPTELYAALQAGPGRWLRGNLESGTLESLPAKLRRLLDRALASELSAVITRWVEWDIRNLRKRRDALLTEQKEAEAAERAQARVVSHQPAVRRPPTPQELADRQRDRGGHFTPPPRT